MMFSLLTSSRDGLSIVRMLTRAISDASDRCDQIREAQKRVTTITRAIATAALVQERRIKMIPIVLAGWSVPVSVLYAIGWSVGWVRQGFNAETPNKSSYQT